MNWKNCQKNLPIMTNFTFGNGTLDKIEISGFFNVTENLKDFECTLEAFKCPLDMKSCERYPTPPAITDMCEKFERKNVYYSNIFSLTEPPVKCPLYGTYKVDKIIFEFPSIFRIFPLDGYTWVTTFKLVDRKTRRLLMCLNTETRILRKRIRNLE
jgi:hypothetical protein